MAGGASYPAKRPGRALMARALGLALVVFAWAAPATADTGDLALCLEAKTTLAAYAHAFEARGWRQVTDQDSEHDRVSRSTAEIIGTLRTFPAAFTDPDEVRAQVARIVRFGREAAFGTAVPAKVALLVQGDRALMLLLQTGKGEARLSCYLSAKALPEVIRRLPEPGRNPSGEPLAWNAASSGPLATPHIFAEILHVRLFFQPAQHLLTGGDAIVTHLTFHRTATST